MNLPKILKALSTELNSLDAQRAKIQTAIDALGGVSGEMGTRRKPKFSKAGIARIRAAQKARWAKIKALKKK